MTADERLVALYARVLAPVVSCREPFRGLGPIKL